MIDTKVQLICTVTIYMTRSAGIPNASATIIECIKCNGWNSYEIYKYLNVCFSMIKGVNRKTMVDSHK